MTCPTCKAEAQRFGTNRNGSQRFRCVECKKTFSAKPADRVEGSYIEMARVEKVLQLLIEGCSVRSIERISGLHRDTILKLLVTAGEKCEALMGRLIVNVPVKDVECDEIWSFIGKKEKQVAEEDDVNYGDAYCFVAMERNTKLVLNFALGKRNQATTDIFIEGLRHATSRQHYQITASNHRNRFRTVRFRHREHAGGSRGLRTTHQGLSRHARGRTQILTG
jgi:transposase-like protein